MNYSKKNHQIQLTNLSNQDFKEMIRILQKIIETDKEIAKLLNITEKQVKKFSFKNREKLEEILKHLFNSSPKMFLGTIDYLFTTNYLTEYFNGILTDDEITFLSTDFVRKTISFEVLKADVIIQIKNYIYQIEFQTSNDNMAIRLVRYAPEFGITNSNYSQKKQVYEFEIPHQAVIYLEQNKNNPLSNNYELLQDGKVLTHITIPNIKIWSLDEQAVYKHKIYLLLPVLIFKYRLMFEKAQRDKDILNQLKEDFLCDVKQTLINLSKLYKDLNPQDIDIIKFTLGEFVLYFDNIYFENQIKMSGEFRMTFTEEILGYREEINKARQAALEEGKQEGKQKGLQEGLQKSIQEGEKQIKLIIAAQLLDQGMTKQEVAQITGIGLRDILELIKNREL
ncbi:hypothetical protein AN641_09275 [Candidatus Epulonipiscioides gigas]|nr:hypothetical protein AN641_09275 [Epulopiscium sp. SCG-C07WGA-EpuloA2]